MTQERYEHGPLVEAWLKEPTFVPAADLARVSTAIAQTPQRRDRPFRLPHVRFQLMLNATKAATIVAILGVSGALLAMQLGTTDPGTDQAPAAAMETATAATAAPSTVEPTTTEAVERSSPGFIALPDELPEDAESGTIEAPDGMVRWVHMPRTGGEGGPHDHRVLPWTDGIAFSTPAQPKSPASLMASANGVDWNEVHLPKGVTEAVAHGSHASVFHLDGDTYLLDPDTSRLWRPGDSGKWQQLDATAAQAVLPSSWDRTLSVITRSGVVDGKPIIEVKHWIQLPRGKLNLPNNPEGMYRLGDQVYGICGKGGRDCTRASAKRVLRITETGKGLVVRDDRTGKRLGLLKGASASELYEGVVGAIYQWFEIQGDAVVDTTRPPAGWAEEEVRTRPAPPADTDYLYHVGSTWRAGTMTYSFETPPWLYLGGEWIEATQLGFPEVEHGAWTTSGTGNATLIWVWSDDGAFQGLTVVESPSST